MYTQKGGNMANTTISVEYKLLNSQFNQSISEINKEISTLNKEFKLQQEQMKLSGTETEKLQASLDNLNKKYELSRQKTEEIKKALENAKATFGESSKEARQWQNKLLDAEKTEASLKNKITETNLALEKAKEAESGAAQASEKRLEALKRLESEEESLKNSNEKLNKQYELQRLQLGEGASASQKQRLEKERLKETLKNEKEQTENLNKQLEIAKQQYGENSVEVEKLDKKLLENKITVHNLTVEYEKATDKLENTKKKLDSVSEKTGKAGKSFTKNITAPIAALGAGSLKAMESVEEAFDIVIKKTGATGEASKRLKTNFDNVYKEMPEDAGKVAEAIGEVNTQFGLQGPALEKTSKDILKFSRITDTDVTQSTLNAKKTIEQFNLKTSDTPRVLDVFAKAAQNTGVDVNELFENVQKAGPTLTGMGLGLEESTNLIASLSQEGFDASRTINAITKANVEFAKENKSVKDGMQELIPAIKNASTEQEAINLAAKVFGTKNAPAMVKAIKSGTLSLESFKNTASNAHGTVSKTFKQTEHASDEFKKSMHQLQLAGAELGEQLLKELAPILEDVVKLVKDFSTWFSKLSESQKQTIIKTALVIASIGPLLLVFSKLAAGASTLISIFSTLHGAFAFAFRGAEAGTTAIRVLGTVLKGIGPIFTGLFNVAKFALSGIMSVFSGLIEAIIGVIVANPIVAVLVVAVAALAFIWYKWGDDIKAWFIQHWEALKNVLSSGFTSFKNTCSADLTAIKNFFVGIWDFIKDATVQKFNSIVDSAVNFGTGVHNALTSGIRTAVRGATGLWDGLYKSVTNVFSNIKSFIKNSLIHLHNLFITSEFHLPHIKLPHFRMNGEFNLDPFNFELPSFWIDWYAKGGIATGPRIIGVGEDGNEAIVPLSNNRYMQPFADAIADRISGQHQQIINLVINQDVKETADFRKSAGIIEKELRRRKLIINTGRGGV